jgi:hypothetical protein
LKFPKTINIGIRDYTPVLSLVVIYSDFFPACRFAALIARSVALVLVVAAIPVFFTAVLEVVVKKFEVVFEVVFEAVGRWCSAVEEEVVVFAVGAQSPLAPAPPGVFHT